MSSWPHDARGPRDSPRRSRGHTPRYPQALLRGTHYRSRLSCGQVGTTSEEEYTLAKHGATGPRRAGCTDGDSDSAAPEPTSPRDRGDAKQPRASHAPRYRVAAAI